MPDQSPNPLLSDEVRGCIEQLVSAHLGRPWRPTTMHNRADQASHTALVLSDESISVFVKLGAGRRALDQFGSEVDGLRLLSERAGVLTPVVIASLPIAGGAMIIMEAVKVVIRQDRHWQQMGEALARIHRVSWDRFGIETDCYWGDLYQDNRPLAEWPDFFWQRRISPRLRAAIDSGHLPVEFVPQVEKVCARLTELCGPQIEPTLLHGDAHQNNFLSTANGPVFIDPAVYYGHPEIDLAHIDVFEPVPNAFFWAYREHAPLDPGFAQRRDLWRIPFWLAMVEVDGPRQVPQLEKALRQYV